MRFALLAAAMVAVVAAKRGQRTGDKPHHDGKLAMKAMQVCKKTVSAEAGPMAMKMCVTKKISNIRSAVMCKKKMHVKGKMNMKQKKHLKTCVKKVAMRCAKKLNVTKPISADDLAKVKKCTGMRL